MARTYSIRGSELAGVALVILFFIGATVFAQQYAATLEQSMGVQSFGPAVYVGISIAAIVVAPVSTLPLLPVAATLWGPIWAAVLSIIGWALGSMIAFWLARRYGTPLVYKFIDAKKIEEFSKRLAPQQLFWSVVFLRMAIPVDVLSYALALFSTMKFWPYALATVIGISPFAFYFSYAATFPPMYQFVALVAAGGFSIFGIWHTKRRSQKRSKTNAS